MITFMVNMSCSTPLDDYVNTPDPNFSGKLLQPYPSAQYTVYILNMTSQQWLNGIIIEMKTIFMNIIILFFYRFILITTNLVALYDYYSA